jgi:hypothetical protein
MKCPPARKGCTALKTIGILFGVENSFPSALVEHINARNVETSDGQPVRAEFVLAGAIALRQLPLYAVIIDRISHEVSFYRALLKHAALNGTTVISNPFWASADDKFFNYALADKLGIAVPPTVLLPHKQLPGDTTERSMRNLQYPLDWDSVFSTVGVHGFLKPINGGGWRDVHAIHSREEFFCAYDQSRDLCMIYQKAVNFSSYFRCFVVGQGKVRVMAYDPHRPHAERYIQNPPKVAPTLLKRMKQDALTLCRALGYDLNTVEFAVENGIPYAIDFMNPVPDADVNSVGEENFQWIVREVANLAIAKAIASPAAPNLRWSSMLGAAPAPKSKKKAAGKKSSPAAAIKRAKSKSSKSTPVAPST